MKTILLTTAMTVNIVTSSFEQIKSSETVISNYQLDKKQTQKKISFKQTFDNSKLDRVYSLIKKEFNDIPNLQNNKLLYKFNNEQFTLSIKIKSNNLIVKYSSFNSDENEVVNKIERIREIIKNLN
ncbi:hypothetical protein [Flavobacterium frigidarium]|uniref:Uncharacterized protein n=1 Tax=Flavobacterium frigidarium TaxID=99286 RepID=A0ABV4KCS7_9FLAO